ncbi:hypothetical protein NDU88_000027 [Pleurodeles waltl]|uniref:Uncharacterized protein n=1 Tax=Pleurodeles waltl TaxID=8319 RepID=A0AAV7WIE7_PLEWA|nr:hypothetical protein NDU88_000027 [Pleurodeles waltl]
MEVRCYWARASQGNGIECGGVEETINGLEALTLFKRPHAASFAPRPLLHGCVTLPSNQFSSCYRTRSGSEGSYVVTPRAAAHTPHTLCLRMDLFTVA